MTQAIAQPALLTTATENAFTVTTLDSFASTVSTGEKPQSKVWSHQGRWWTVAADSSGTWVRRLDDTQWTPVLKLLGTSSRADVKVAGELVHVLLYRGESSKLASLQFNPSGAGSYSFWSQRPAVASVSLSPGVESATLDMDSTGRLWIASDAVTTVEVRYSDAPYATWSSPIVVESGISSDDLATIVSLPSGHVGVLWSNQVTQRFGFRTHIDGSSPTLWSSDEVPSSQSAQNIRKGMADDHVSAVVGSDGTIYVAMKTSYDTSGKTEVGLLVRRPNGSWDPMYHVDDVGTRATVVVSESRNLISVIYRNSDSSGPLVYKESTLSSIAFGERKVLLSGSYNNPSSMKQPFTDEVVVVAGDGSSFGSVLLSAVQQANEAPQVSAGDDQTIRLPAVAQLNGIATDDGRPNPAFLTAQWMLVSGPGTASVLNPTSFGTTCSFSVPGVYTLRLQVSDGELIGVDELQVTVLSPVISTATFQNGVAPQSNYSGTQDAKIRDALPTKNFGSATTLQMDGVPRDAALVRWDLSGLSPGSVVHSASITLSVTNASVDKYEVYELKRDWIENQVTWNRFAINSPWATPGASGNDDRGSVVLATIAATATGKVTFQFNQAGLQLIQSWIDNPAKNFGLIFQDYGAADSIEFNSKEVVSVQDRPRFSIDYSPPAEAELTRSTATTALRTTSPKAFYVSSASGTLSDGNKASDRGTKPAKPIAVRPKGRGESQAPVAAAVLPLQDRVSHLQSPYPIPKVNTKGIDAVLAAGVPLSPFES